MTDLAKSKGSELLDALIENLRDVRVDIDHAYGALVKVAEPWAHNDALLKHERIVGLGAVEAAMIAMKKAGDAAQGSGVRSPAWLTEVVSAARQGVLIHREMLKPKQHLAVKMESPDGQ